MEYFMQCIKNKIFRLFIALCVVLPLHGMFSKRAFDRMQQMQRKSAQQRRSFQLSQPVNIKNDYQTNATKITAIQKPTFLSWFSNWPTELVSTIKPIEPDLNISTQSEEIVNELRTKGFLSDSLIKTIEQFLENNNSNAIKNVFNELLKHFDGGDLLEKYTKNLLLTIKLIPLIQESLADPTLITVPVLQSSSASLHLLSFTAKALLQLSQNTDSAPIHTINKIKQQLLEILTAHPLYIIFSNISVTTLLSILPDDIENFIAITNKWDTHIEVDVKDSNKRNNQYYIKSFINKVSALFARKLIKETNKETKQRLCTIIFEKEYADQIIKNITPHVSNSISDIISVFKKKLLTDDIYKINFDLLTMNMLDLAKEGNPLVAKDLMDSITAQFKSTAQLKKASKSPASLSLLTKILSPLEMLQKILNINKKYSETASYKHLEKYASDIAKNYASHIARNVPTIFSNPNLIFMIQSAIKKEKELNDLGYETFYHGRRWEYGLLTDIWKMLFEYKSGKKLPNDFIPTHLDDPAIGKIHPRFFTSEQAKQELLLKKGNVAPDSIGIAGYETLLFLNKFLFGNTTDLGESSIDYMLKNRNIKDIGLSISEIFAMFGYSDIYTLYAQKLETLEKKYNTLSPYGELLLIAIPKEKIDKYVYYTIFGGRSDDGQRKSFNIPGVGETMDIEKIIKYQNKTPQDTGIYNLINTKTAGLDPGSGIKTFPLNAVDPDKMKEFKKEENNLLSEIKKSLAEKNVKKTIKKRSRE